MPRRCRIAQKQPTSRHTPYPHQQKCLDSYMLEFQHWAILMEQRLGKTITTIWGFQREGGTQSNIVAAPGTVLGAWAIELKTEGELFVVAAGLPPQKRLQAVYWVQHPEPGQRRWLLMNYESVRATPIIATLKWYGVICDESVIICNAQAQVTKLFIKGFRDAVHRVILSGLISPEGEWQVFAQMVFLWGSFMGFNSWWKWREYYFEPDYDGASWRVKWQFRGAIKKAVHELAYIVRRKDVNMGGKKVYERRIVPMSPEQAKLYKEVETTWNSLGLEGTSAEDTMHAIVVSTWLRRIAGGFTPETLELVSAGLYNQLISDLRGDLRNEKVVVWFAFREELAEAEKRLAQHNIRSVSIHGGIPMAARSGKLAVFAGDEGVQCLLATEQCAKYGINASAASTAIYYSNTWSSNERAQSSDRTVHTEKKEDQLIIDYAAAGTVAVEVIDAVMSKVQGAIEFMRLLKQLREGGNT